MEEWKCFTLSHKSKVLVRKILTGLYLEINQPALRPFGPAEGVVEEQVQGRETAQALQGLLSSSHLHKTALRGRNSVAHTDALMPPLLSGHHSVMVTHKTWHKEGFCQNRFNSATLSPIFNQEAENVPSNLGTVCLSAIPLQNCHSQSKTKLAQLQSHIGIKWMGLLSVMQIHPTTAGMYHLCLRRPSFKLHVILFLRTRGPIPLITIRDGRTHLHWFYQIMKSMINGNSSNLKWVHDILVHFPVQNHPLEYKPSFQPVPTIYISIRCFNYVWRPFLQIEGNERTIDYASL